MNEERTMILEPAELRQALRERRPGKGWSYSNKEAERMIAEQYDLRARPEPTAKKALREAAQRVADKYCDLMGEDGRACSEDCECWHSHGRGCDGSSAIYRAALATPESKEEP